MPQIYFGLEFLAAMGVKDCWLLWADNGEDGIIDNGTNQQTESV